MPHSPYQTTVYEPIRNLDSIRSDLNQHRAQIDNDVRNKYVGEELLETADLLLEQCDFLDTKLDLKKRQYDRLLNENGDLEKRIEALEKDVQSKAEENIGLQKELERISSGDKSRIDHESLNSENVNTRSTMRQACPGDLVITNPHKRGPEAESLVDEKSSKSAKTEAM